MVPGVEINLLGSENWRKPSEPIIYTCSGPPYPAYLLMFQVVNRVLWWCGIKGRGGEGSSVGSTCDVGRNRDADACGMSVWPVTGGSSLREGIGGGCFFVLAVVEC